MPLIQDIMRWDMTVLRESPWYQEILQQGIERGVQQGIERGVQQGIERGVQQGIERGVQQGIERGVQQGIERGVQQERQASLIRILQLKFGDVPSEISMNLQSQDLQRLEGLMAIAFSAISLDKFRQHL
jgi:flagellar biosynthesis/type III secretory pathway protein FliH